VKAGHGSCALIDVLQKLDSTLIQDSRLALLFKALPILRTRLEQRLDNIAQPAWPEAEILKSRF